ncbi:MAG: T9SS type A sorting domain-containing protein [Candidatus Eisenbacteria bacterium]
MQAGDNHIEIFRPDGVGNWELVLDYEPSPVGGQNGFAAWDLNQNGRDELLWFGNGTRIVEHQPDPASVGENPLDVSAKVRVFPNPSAGWTRFEARHSSAFEVWSVDGRLRTRVEASAGLGSIDARTLGSGVYLVRAPGHSEATRWVVTKVGRAGAGRARHIRPRRGYPHAQDPCTTS